MPKNKSQKGKIKDTSPYVHQSEKIKYDLAIKELPWTDKQKELISIIEDKETRAVLISGPAGTSKSIIAIYSGLKALNSRKNSHILYSRPIIESSDSSAKLGYLPGNIDDKIEPYKIVIKEKLDELLSKEDPGKLMKENRIEFVEVNYMRGRSLNAVFLILDESQNYTFSEIETMLTRVGKYSKVIVLADPNQSDLPFNKQGGFVKFWNKFSEDNIEASKHGIKSFEFSEDDILRSEFCKYIVKAVKQIKEGNLKGECSPSDSKPHLR